MELLVSSIDLLMDPGLILEVCGLKGKNLGRIVKTYLSSKVA